MSEQIKRLIKEALDLPQGLERGEILEEAIRMADAEGHIKLAYEARGELINTAAYNNQPEKKLLNFSWCLNQFDAQPEEFDLWELLWRYKWIVVELPTFPEVTRTQIEEMFQDFQRRYTEAGFSMRVVHQKRMQVARSMGNMEEAASEFKKFSELSRDIMCDCLACEQNIQVVTLSGLGRDEEALVAAEPILNGTMSCSHVPTITYGNVIQPLMRLGRLDEAKKYDGLGYRRAARNRCYLDHIANFLLYRTKTQDFAKGIRMFERHCDWAFDTASSISRIRFYISVMCLFEVLAEARPRARKVVLPKEHPLYREESTFAPAELAQWARSEAESIATRLDARNENDYYVNEIATTLKLVAS